MESYKNHIFICNHGNCAPLENVGKIKFVLRKALGKLTDVENPDWVMITMVDCFGICRNGSCQGNLSRGHLVQPFK